MAGKANWRFAYFRLLLLGRKKDADARQSASNGGALRMLGRSTYEYACRRRAGELERELRANPAVAKVEVVYWDEVVKMEGAN